MTVDHVRCPSEFLDCLENSSCKEYGSLAVILEEFAVRVAIYALTVEIVFVINEIHLHPGRGYGCDLDDKWSVHVVDDDVHARQPDHFVELILPFVDAAVPRHERAYFLLPFLNALRKISSDVCYRRFREIWKYLRIDKQYSFDRISHSGNF